MRNRIIAMFTTRHLAEVPENPGRGIEGAQASTEQQPIVRLWDAVRFEHFSSSATESVAGKSSVFQVGESGALRTCAATIVCR